MDFAMNPPLWVRHSMHGRRRGPRPPWLDQAADGPGPREGRGPRPPFGSGDFGPGFGPGGFGPGFGFGPGGPGFPFGPDRGRGRRRRGDVRQAILALLTEGPLNGYQVIQSLAEKTGGAWKPSPGAVYPSLAQLEDEGLVEQFDNEGQRSFRLTEAGRAAAEGAERPWETINAENAPRDPESVGAMWRAFGDLAMATKTVMRSGNAEQIRQAGALLADTRRKLFGILASEADLPNGDDLR